MGRSAVGTLMRNRRTEVLESRDIIIRVETGPRQALCERGRPEHSQLDIVTSRRDLPNMPLKKSLLHLMPVSVSARVCARLDDRDDAPEVGAEGNENEKQHRDVEHRSKARERLADVSFGWKSQCTLRQRGVSGCW